MQAGFYMTPILYPIALITNLKLQKLIMLSPMAQTIQDARYAAISHDTITTSKIFNGGWYAYIPYLIVIVVFILGTIYFKSQAKYFAEDI
jgi:ABC-2 type transport system permease protein